MKKILGLLMVAVIVLSCNADDDFGGGGLLQPVSFTVNCTYDAKNYNGLPAKQATVVLKNTSTSDEYTATANSAGIASFDHILPGTYNVRVTQKLDKEAFFALFGYYPIEEEVSFNGAQEKVIANANVSTTNIELKAARMGDLVIKQIYYAGSHASQGAVFRDQFIEIYNNSNETIYADGLYIGQLYGKANTNLSTYTLSNGQFDWSKSIGISAGNAANTDYVYADYVLQVPGSGKQYPVLPGASIVIAQTGINHKSPLVDNSGIPLPIKNPDLTVDLSTADFEVYLGDFRVGLGLDIYRYDIQNPAVTDMIIAYWGKSTSLSSNKDFLMENGGKDSFVIFRADDFSVWPDYTDPSVTAILPDSKYFVQIPSSTIIDGVELQYYNPSAQRPKMLSSDIDASYINCDAQFNSQSVIRKTKAVVNGQKILEDSNNSANDFVKLSMANPRGFAD